MRRAFFNSTQMMSEGRFKTVKKKKKKCLTLCQEFPGREERECAGLTEIIYILVRILKYQKMTMVSTEKCEVKEEVIILQQKWVSAHLSGDRVSDG